MVVLSDPFVVGFRRELVKDREPTLPHVPCCVVGLVSADLQGCWPEWCLGKLISSEEVREPIVRENDLCYL